MEKQQHHSNNNNEFMQQRCFSLIKEVKEKMQELKEFGMSEKDIVSCLHSNQPLPQMIIKNNRIFLGDARKEVCMQPLVKVVYLLFLRHPEGIAFKALPDYRDELLRLYAEIRPSKLSPKAIRSIEDVTNPLHNSINEKCARIRRIMINLLGENCASKYYIQGSRGYAKRISLPRDLVVWEE